MKFYKADKKLNIVQRESCRFKTNTNYSDKKTFNLLSGFDAEYCDAREVLYLYPKNSRGESHQLRWSSIEKEDIPQLIEMLKKFI